MAHQLPQQLPQQPPQPRPQPPAITQNRVRIVWTEDQCLYLIDQRLTRNDEFGAWRAIAGRVFGNLHFYSLF